MQTYYSIISIHLNHTLQERIGVGMLLVSGDQLYFRVAEDKLAALKGVLSAEKISFARTYLRNLQREVESTRKQILPGFSTITPPWSSKSYMDYLSKYANNLLQFSEPKALDIPVNTNVFAELFKKWIFESAVLSDAPARLSAHELVEERLYPKIDQRVNLDVTLTQDTFSELFLPVEVNFIGKNGSPVIGQAVDFEKRNYDLEYDLTRFGTLIKAVESFENKEGTYFVMGTEPTKNNAKQHQLWSQVLDSGMFRFVGLDELQLIEQFVKQNEVEPYFG